MNAGADVAVVGAGVVGLSIAYYLARAGADVILIEKGALAAGASGDNLGQLSVLDREEPAELRWTRESLALYREIAEEEGVETELLQSGGLLLFRSEEQKRLGLELMERQSARGIPVSYLDVDDIRTIEPYFSGGDAVGGLHCPWEGSIMPLKILSGLTEAIKRRGARVHYRTEVTDFETRGDSVTKLHTTGGTIEVRSVVLATGSWTAELCDKLGVEVPVHYHRGTALVTVPVPRYIRTVIVSGGFLLNRPITGRVVGLGVAQHLNGSIIIGQASETSLDYDRSLTVEGVYETIRNFLVYFPSLRDLEFIRVWAGNTTYTEDGFPVYGYSSTFSNLFFAAGLKGAFSTALGAGRMAAGLIEAGRDSTELMTMQPERGKRVYGKYNQL